MTAPHNVEFEAAKFLQKLIHDSKDEPEKLATKLYVILQHMKASGKENSMPYQVISRAMETVTNQHGLDVEALMSSRVPLSGGSQMGEASGVQQAGSSQPVQTLTDSRSGLAENDTSAPGRLPAGLSSGVRDTYQGSHSHRNAKSFDHESPSSVDTRSASMHSHERRETGSLDQQGNQTDAERASVKRKRSDPAFALEPRMGSTEQVDAYAGVADTRKGKLIRKNEMPGTFPGSPSAESSAVKGVGDEYWKQGFLKGTGMNSQRVMQGHLLPSNQGAVTMANPIPPSRLAMDHAGGISNMSGNVIQDGIQSNRTDTGMLRGSASGDTGKSPMILDPSVSSMPFKEHHLKQLRAQCLVFLAFRNGLMPKNLHLEIALGNMFSKEGSSASVDGAQKEPVDEKGKEQPANRASEADSYAKDTDSTRTVGGKATASANPSVVEGDKLLPSARVNMEADMQNHGINGSSVLMMGGSQLGYSNVSSSGYNVFEDNAEIGHMHLGSLSHVPSALELNKQPTPELMGWIGSGVPNEASGGPLTASVGRHDLMTGRDVSSGQSQIFGGSMYQLPNTHLSSSWKAIQEPDGDQQRALQEHDEDDRSTSACLPLSTKYSMSEKWIMAHRRRKLVSEQKWAQKQQKADQRIAARLDKLKEAVSLSKDISAKTRSVIELKKLQLLELQRCLRRDILDDFFRPISVEMDRLRQIKKHRTGRRPKIIEKYDQRMKEERHKRIRERQKEFFSEIEVHKERLEDVFKFKRERLKGFNRYVKELHKRKERTHREKNDRIQREKINLLKINDVEGYLRMVQDAKSDRVNQLLKETEKYLQKLGSKLKDAKATSRRVEVETDENGTGAVDEIYEIANETEDENDQAKHYKESNEKYYMIAHSIKENITEQPAGLRGGKLREYQMNGLRWLVSLYNNHLNGILADEMGLGKTVQVISLLLYLMEMKNDRGPFLVVVPSSVLPGWEQEISFWAPGINKIIYAGPPEERRRLFKESIIHLKFNVLLTTYEYLMNKHDRPKLSKIYWHYVIIDEGHRIKNASCKLNADLKHYHSSHRLLLTGTPLQNNLEELWALLNFLLPNIFNSSEDFSQWFNKPFESSGDSSADEVLLSEEENLLIINRLHQVLRPFVLRRLKHKVENQLPEKIERLIRCEASAYQKLLMKRVEENLGSLGMSKARAIHNSVIELRNICNHPYLSQLHAEEVDSLIPKHFLPPIVRLCGKLEMLDRLLPKLKATNHRVLLFSTMTRLLDVMEEYLVWKQYRYLRLDGQTSGLDRGALIEQFNQPGSPFFIFLLSIRAGGVGVNLQAADTVIIFDTDWNPQVDLQAQARAHRIGQKKDVLVLRLETINTVEEQVRAAAEHKLGVANQSITAGFFDNNTSAEDRREYLESLLRECKKEEAATVLDDEALNDVIARSESEIDVFESMDQKRREEEMAAWNTLVVEQGANPENVPLLPSRLVTEDDLKPFYEAMKVYDRSNQEGSSSAGLKRDSGSLGGFDTQHYGRGKRAREVRSYEERWNEEEFEKMCQADSPESSEHKGELTGTGITGLPSQAHLPLAPVLADTKKEITPPVKRGRGRPRKTPVAVKQVVDMQKPTVSNIPIHSAVDSRPNPGIMKETSERNSQLDVGISSTSDAALSGLPASDHGPQATQPYLVATEQQGGKGQGGTETVRRRGRKSLHVTPSVSTDTAAPDPKSNEQPGTQVSADVVTTSAPEAVGIPIPHTSASSASQTQKPSEQQLKIASSGISAIATVPVASLEENKLNPTSQSQTTTPHESDAGPTSAVQDPNNGRQQDKNASLDISSTAAVLLTPSEASKPDCKLPGKVATVPGSSSGTAVTAVGGGVPQPGALSSQSTPPSLGGHRPGKRQSQKFESRTEPVRRRGRRCAQTVTASTELSPVQDPKLMEPLKGTTTVTPPTMTCAPAPSGTVPPGLGSSAVTVPVIPVVPVSSVMPGSAVTDVAGSMHHINVSSATGIPVTSQLSQTTPIPDPSSLSSRPHDSQSKASGRAAGRGRGRGRKSRSVETAPRRRGRKSGSTFDAVPYLDVQKSNTRQTEVKSVELVECKAMATSGEDKSSQASIIKDETCTAPSTIAPGSQDSKEKVQSSFSSSFESQKGHNIAASPDVKDLASLKSKAIDMPPDSRATSISGDVASCSPADPLLASSRAGNEPPKTPAGKTHTIVLALESVSVPEGLAKDYTAGSALPSQPVVAEPLASKSSQAAQSHLVEEMSAPPGFDKPKTWLSDATVGKSKESGAGQASKTPEGKTNFVVLALESGARNVDMLSVKSGSTSEKEASSEVQRNKDSVPESAISSNPKAHRLKINSATDIVANSQLDEIPPPPGFGIQKTGSSDVEIRKSLESDDVAIGQNTSIGKQTPESENKAAIGSDKISIDANQASEEDAPPGFTTSNLHSSDPKHSKLLESGHTDLSHGSAVLHDISGPKPVIAAVSDVSMAELSHPNEDSVPPGFGVPQTSLAQENNGRPSESEGGELPTNELQTDAPSVGIQSGCDKEIRETVQALQTAAGTGSERSGKGLADDGDLHVVKEGKDIVPDNKLASKPVIDEALVGTEVPLSETTSETQDQCLKECDLEIQAAHIAAAGDNATSEKCEELVNDGNLNVQVEEDLDVDNAVAPEPDIENSGVVQTQIPPSKTLAATSETDPVKSATLVMNAPLDKHVELEAVDGHSHVQKEDLDHKQDLCLEPEANEVEAQKSIGASAPMQEDGKDETKQLATVVEIVVKSGQLEGEDVTTSDSSQQDVPSSEVPHDVGRSLDVDVMPEPMECEQESTNTEVLAEDVAVRLEATDAVSVKDDVGENAVLEKPPEAGDTNTGSGTGASISNQELGKEDNDITAVYVEKTREEYQSESRSTNMNACQMDSGSCEVQPANNNVVVDAGETVDPVAISLSETCEKGCVDYAKSTDHGKQSSQPMTESSTDGFSQVASPKISTEGQKDELISANASSTGASHVQADSASESKVLEESQGPDVGKAEVEALAVSSEIRGSSRQQSEENNPDSSPCNITGSRLQEENEGVSRDVLNDGDSCQIQPSVSNGAEVISQPEASEVGSAHTVDNAVNSGIDTARVSEPETCQESSPIEAGVVGTLTESKQAEEHAVVQEDNQNDGGCDIPQIVESDIDITVMSKSDGCELRTVQATDVMEEDVANPQEPVEACTDVMEVGQGDGGTSDVHQSFDVTSDVAMIPEPEAHEEGERHVTGLMDHVADSGKQVEDNADISHGDLRDGASCGTQGGVNVNRVDDVHPQPEMFGEKSAHTTNSADEVSESMQLMENTSALEPAGAVSIIECQKDEAQSEEYVDHDVDIQDRKDGASSEKLPDNGDTRASTHVEASDNVKDWEKQPEDDGTHTVPEASDMVEVQKNEDLCEKLPADDDEILTDAHAGSLYIEGQLHEGNVNSSVGASGNMEDEQKPEDRCEELPDDGKTHSSTHVGSSNIEDQKDHTDSKKYCKGDDACTAAGASGNIEDQQKNEDQCEKLTDGTAIQVGSSEHIEGQNNKVDCEKLPENDDTHTGDGNSDNFKDQKMNEIRDGSSEHFEGQKKEVECEKLPEYDDTNTADGNSDNFEDQQMNEIQDGSSEHVEGQKKEVECEKLPEYGDTHTADGNSDNFEDQQMNEIQDGSSEHVEGQKKEVECEKLPEYDDTHTADGNSDNLEDQQMNEIQDGSSEHVEGQKKEVECEKLPEYGDTNTADGNSDNFEDQQMNEIQDGSSEHVEGQKKEVECEKLPENDDTHTAAVGNSDNVEGQPMNEIHHEKLPGDSESHTAVQIGLSDDIEGQKDNADHGTVPEVHGAYTSVGESDIILDQQMNEDQCKELPPDDKPQTAAHFGSSDIEIGKSEAEGGKFPDDADTPAVGVPDNVEDQQMNEIQVGSSEHVEGQKNEVECEKLPEKDDTHTTVGNSDNVEDQPLNNEVECEKLPENDDTRTTVGNSDNVEDQPLNEIHDEKLPGRSELHTAAEVGLSEHIECQKDVADCGKAREVDDARTSVGETENILDQQMNEDQCKELPDDDKPQTATHVGSSDLEIAKGKADGEKFPDDVDTPAVGASDNIEDQQKDEYNEKLLDYDTEKQKDTFDSQNPHKDGDVHTTVGQSENMEHQQKNEDHCEELSDGKSHNASHDASSDIEGQKDKAYCEKPLEGEDSRSIVGASDDVDAHTIVGASDNIEDQPKIEDHHEELPRDDIQGQKDETDRERSFEGDHGLTANEASEDQQKMQDRHEELPCDAIKGQTDKPNSKKTPEGNETDEMEDQIFEDCCENLPDDDDDNDNDNDETCTTPHVVSSDRKDDTEGEKMLNSDGIVASGLVETSLNQPGSGSGSGSEYKVQEGPHDMEVD